MVLPAIEPASVQLVPQCHNQLRHRVPRNELLVAIFCWSLALLFRAASLVPSDLRMVSRCTLIVVFCDKQFQAVAFRAI
jgi:hypothetical protein